MERRHLPASDRARPRVEAETRIEFRFCAVTQPLESVHHPMVDRAFFSRIRVSSYPWPTLVHFCEPQKEEMAKTERKRAFAHALRANYKGPIDLGKYHFLK